MIAHPKTMQIVIDQRWQELRVETLRERRVMTALEQTPAATPFAAPWLRLANVVRMLNPILGRDVEIGMPRSVRRSLIS